MRVLLAILFVCALFVPTAAPVQAQTTKNVKFYQYLDGNGNGVLDYIGYDYCLGGNTLTVSKIGSGLQPWFYLPITHADQPITTYAAVMDCKYNSSATYQLLLGDWKIVGGTPSYTTNFNVPTNVTTLIQGHRVLTWSGE